MNTRSEFKRLLIQFLYAVGVAVVLMLVVYYPVRRLVYLDRTHSYYLFPSAGDWRVETNGISFRASVMDDNGNWHPCSNTHDNYITAGEEGSSVSRKYRKPSEWEAM